MIFKDRFYAGRLLAKRLSQYKGRNCIVLAIPKGGIEIGYTIAEILGISLEPALVKKIGHPLNPELAIGAVGLGSEIIDSRFEDVPKEYLRQEIVSLRELLKKRQEIYLDGKKPADLQGKTVILVDNGIATGSTVLVAISMIRKHNPAKIIVAVPVAPPSVIERFEEAADEVVCLYAPEDFVGVGQFYERFEQVSDEEAVRLLRDHNQQLSKKIK